MRRLVPVAVLAAVALAACAGSSSGGSSPPRAPTSPDEVVVRVVTEGAYFAETRRPDHLPKLSVFGDGRVVVVGPTTLEYPGPALPNLQEFRVTPDGLARVLDAARAAGLLGDEPPDYGKPGITDQATTTVTVRADGVTRRADAYALGFKGRLSGVTPEQSDNRRRLERFIEQAGDVDALRDDVVPGSERRYEPTALGVLVRPSVVTDTETRDWPLGDLAGTDCVVLTGAEAATASAAARGTSDGDTWMSAGAMYGLDFRPLLPDEHSCDDVVSSR
jgi:hypothetical protein